MTQNTLTDYVNYLDKISSSLEVILKTVNLHQNLTHDRKIEKSQATLYLFNQFVIVVSGFYNRLSTDQRAQITTRFYNLRNKTIKVFEKLDIEVEVPTNFRQIVFEPYLLDNMEPSDLIKLASSIMKDQYDGNPSNLDAFIDSLELVNLSIPASAANRNTLVTTAIKFVKTRLTAKARDLITDSDNTIQLIIDKLKENMHRSLMFPTSPSQITKTYQPSQHY